MFAYRIADLRYTIFDATGARLQGRENNLLINVEHPQFVLITADPPERVHWDERLFSRPAK